MSELRYINEAARQYAAGQDPTLRSYCELTMFGETTTPIEPELAEQLAITPPHALQIDLTRMYGISFEQAQRVMEDCWQSLYEEYVA